MKHSGLPFPEVLVTAEDITRKKPNPEPYLKAARRLGIAPGRCAVIEDAPAGIEADRAAGMQTVAIASTHDWQALTEADVIAGRLADIQIEPCNHPRSNGRVRIFINPSSSDSR